MIGFLKDWVLNIVTLVIILVLLEILLPSGKMKKFVSLVAGFILIIAIINPFLGLMKNGADLKDIQMSNNNFIDRKEIEENSKILNDKQMKQVAEVYRKKVISQIEESAMEVNGVEGAKADVIINDDYKSKSFGEVKRVYVSLKLGDKNRTVKPVSNVERVKIDVNGDKSGKKPESTSKEVGSDLKKQIEEKIGKMLYVGKENIIISLQNQEAKGRF